MKSSLLLVGSLLMLSVCASAQTLSGKLVDENARPISFANVSLHRANDSVFVKGTVTDTTGSYTLALPAAGDYFIRYTAIGYSMTVSKSISVSNPVNDLGTTVLKADAKGLENITVTALRPSIVQKADRLVVSIEGTAMAAGNNALQVLANAPGVFIDGDGNIQLNGRSGVTVMIDGRLTRLSTRDLRNLLQSMAAENIKDIEIITNPSAKYDAEGTSGILNINLKKNTRQGMSGSVYSSYLNNFREQYTVTAGGSINFTKGRWNSFIQADYSRRMGGRDATFTRIFYRPGNTIYFDQAAIGNYQVQGPPVLRMGTDYTINKKHSVGGMFYLTRATWKEEFLTDTYIGNAPKVPEQYIDANNFDRTRTRNISTNLHHVFKIDTIGTLLSTDLDYINIRNRASGDIQNYYDDLVMAQHRSDMLHTANNSGYDIYSGKVDFSTPLRKNQRLEAGIKAAQVISDNDFRFYFNNTGLVLDPLRTNHFNYRENIYAAYANWNRVLSKKVTVQAGLRAEQTQSVGKSLTTGQVTRRSYLDFFPSFFVQQQVSENYGINYNYSRRLSRPNYGNLNPYKAYRDPYTWTEGNPYLRPQYSHSFSITQTFRKSYILSLSYVLTKDVISEIPILNTTDATTIYTTGNVNDGHSAAMGLVVPQKITKRWDTRNSVMITYNRFSMQTATSRVVNEQTQFLFQSIHTILLPKNFRLELNVVYRGPAAAGLYHQKASHKVDVAVKKSLVKKKLELSLSGTDLFKGSRYVWTTDIDGNVNDFNQYFRFRSINVTLRYNFSKGAKVNVKQRSGVEEAGRAN